MGGMNGSGMLSNSRGLPSSAFSNHIHNSSSRQQQQQHFSSSGTPMMNMNMSMNMATPMDPNEAKHLYFAHYNGLEVK